jgi:hypothetical protein
MVILCLSVCTLLLFSFLKKDYELGDMARSLQRANPKYLSAIKSEQLEKLLRMVHTHLSEELDAMIGLTSPTKKAEKNLNTVSEEELKTRKAEMNETFEANKVDTSDPNYQ